MTLKLIPLLPTDALDFTRIRALAYGGPTHDLLHSSQPISEASIRGVAQDREKEIRKALEEKTVGKEQKTWFLGVCDSELKGKDDGEEVRNYKGDNIEQERGGGKLIAIAMWSLHNSEKEEKEKEEDGKEHQIPFLPPELRLDALDALISPLRTAQLEIMHDITSTYLKLNMLATHPDHQGRGAGKLLLNWGLEMADQKGLITYLDASEKGWFMYKRRGFEVVREIVFDRGEWGGEGKDWYRCMVRKPRAG